MRRLAVAAFLLLCNAAFALDQPEAPVQNPLGTTSDFLQYHPDQSYRLDGLKAYHDGNYDFALRDFRTAARFADKPAQAMLASMYWEGRSVQQDRALAYAWMDLAAERGYPWLLADRERYWQGMTEDEHRRAIEVGQAIYDEYGDDAAMPRLGVWMHRGKMQATGSHAGFVGNMSEHKPSPAGLLAGASWDGNAYYAARYWQPIEYLGWQNSTWHPSSTGKVDVGALEKVPDAKPAAPAQPDPDARHH